MIKNPEIDPLTGLLKRTEFDAQFRSFIQTAAKTGQPISLVFTDIDYFLQINENFGHEGGDKVLQAIADILQTQAGEEAVIGRYGGDEFALLFPYTEREQTFLILERTDKFHTSMFFMLRPFIPNANLPCDLHGKYR